MRPQSKSNVGKSKNLSGSMSHLHIDYFKTKLSRLSGVSYRLRNHFNRATTLKFYYACVYSLLTYCMPVYGGALTSHRGDVLAKTHERIVKNLFQPTTHNRCPFKMNRLLKLNDIHKLYAGVHMYRVIVEGGNAVVADTISLQTATHPYDTRQRNDLRTPYPRVEAIRKCYKSQFIKIWNEIPNIKISNSLRVFKHTLTDYLIETY